VHTTILCDRSSSVLFMKLAAAGTAGKNIIQRCEDQVSYQATLGQLQATTGEHQKVRVTQVFQCCNSGVRLFIEGGASKNTQSAFSIGGILRAFCLNIVGISGFRRGAYFLSDFGHRHLYAKLRPSVVLSTSLRCQEFITINIVRAPLNRPHGGSFAIGYKIPL